LSFYDDLEECAPEMKCPRCSAIVGYRSATCHGCGFSLADLAPLYGNQCVQMDRLHDDAACLLKRDRDLVMAAMDQFESRFPQLFCCSYISSFPEATRLSELGFWLLNYAAVSSVDIDRPNENALLLIVDLQSKQVAISPGYFAELLIEEEQMAKALQAARPWFLNGEYGTAIVTVIRQLAKVLSRSSRKLRRRPPEARESVLNPFGQPALPSLRAVKSAVRETEVTA
jgi:hypothetical protein